VLIIWAAKVVVELLKGEDVKAGVLLHPSFVTVDDIKGMNIKLTAKSLFVN
jgi:hypothetical protein